MILVKKLVHGLVGLGTEGQDFTHARRLQILNIVAVLAALTSLIYCAFYAIYDWRHFWREIAFLPLVSALYLSVLLVTRQGRATPAMWVLVGVAVFHLGVISWMLGAESGVLSYLLIVPFVLALLMAEQDRLSVWPIALAVGLLFVLVSLGAQSGSVSRLPEGMQVWIFLFNSFGAILLSCVIAVLFRWLIHKTEAELEAERARSDRLLRAILPDSVIRRLKGRRDAIIAQDIPEATAVFADIVGFTGWAMRTLPSDVVAELNRVFSRMDELCRDRQLEKIKTIGDAYFAVCGAPDPVEDHAERVADFAFDLMDEAASWDSDTLEALRFRIVIATGPMVAGVIGRSKFAYDVWGNTVNLGARMEEFCRPGEILVSSSTEAKLPPRFARETMGVCDIRGQQPTELFRLLARA
ncbi:hypothetical protein AVO45_01040 [Ruegeria marisrubri]|uniref:Guanylate cyclase domain-containing protein n=1 Tax=Ruegeria marisrubri TaxID=1685379 RepID=A0A101CY99_9RHOB|nr:adenylate/guanylate cyclase domain-containing protein [Ruegeria marisrubri]KUJ85608.1 hypothetical protein AVO45_01040 [Ruegeria marisrubri]